MSYYAGIDVSLEESSVCAIDGSGKIVREGKVPSEPKALIAWFSSLGVEFARIGLEAGPTSQWLYAGMQQAGLAVELLETRHVRNAFKIMPVKTDRKDARGIAELIRLGWFRPVHSKSMEAQETRARLTARKLVQKELLETESSLHFARLWPEGRQGVTPSFRRAYQGIGRRASEPGEDCRCAAVGAQDAVA
jgi:transposase